MKNFYLNRVAGAGHQNKIAEGVVFSNGLCVIRWLTSKAGTSMFDTEESMLYTYKNNPTYQIIWTAGGEEKKVFKLRTEEATA